MFKKLNTLLLSSAASIIALIAVIGIGPACASAFYEPPIPEELRK